MPEMKKKFRLTGMEYDEVSLVDAGANQSAFVVLFKRDNTVEKAARKTPQPKDHMGRWISSTSAVKSGEGKGFFFIRKATRAQTNQPVSSGPRGSSGGSWSEGKYARVGAGSGDASGQFAPKSSAPGGVYAKGRVKDPGAPSFPKGGGGGKGGKKGKGGGSKAKKGPAEKPPISPISPASKPMLGSTDDKIVIATDNAKQAHDYADAMKEWAGKVAEWAKRNPSPQNDATAARAAQSAVRAQYAAERADAAIEALKKAKQSAADSAAKKATAAETKAAAAAAKVSSAGSKATTSTHTDTTPRKITVRKRVRKQFSPVHASNLMELAYEISKY